MPRAPRLAQHARDAAPVLDRDGNHVDPARDPVFDQLVLLGGIEARSVRPRSDRRRAPARPLRRRRGSSRNTDRLSPSASWRSPAAWRRPARACSRSGRRSCARHRTHQPDVGDRDHQRPEQDRRAQHGDLTVLHIESLLRSACDAGPPRRIRSSAIVPTSNTPIKHAGQFRWKRRQRRPFFSTASAHSPISVPPIVPRPPNTDVPPRTTAVTASSS